MKSMKKILSVILTVALLSAFFVVPVSAAVSEDAQICASINVLRGDGSGVTEDYLAKLTNRSQGAKILLRLMGLEVEADAYTGTVTFSDASDATLYWQPMLAYLKANPDVGFQGYPDGTFAPNKVMTAQEIYKVLLVSLGYVENVDFTWDQVFTFAAAKGLTSLNGVGEITNDHLATALVEALEATKADGQQLVSFLIDEGVVSLIAAQNAGLVPMELTVMDAFASGSKEVTATLNMAAPAGETAVLKKGTIVWPNIDVEWESNRKTVRFTRDLNFTAGDYTVQVGDSTFDLTIEDETLTGIAIGADYIFPQADQDLQISLYNQYGEAMTIVGTNIFVFANDGTSLATTNSGTTVKVDASVSGLDDATEVIINILHSVSGINASKTIPLYDAPEIKSLNVAGLIIADSASRLEENTSGHELVIEAIDQYGNPYKLTDADVGTSGTIVLMNSNDSSVPSSSFDINTDGNLEFNALAAGSSTITFLVPLQAIVENYIVTVNEPVSLDSVVISSGSTMAYAGEWFELTTFAYDELGQPIDMSGNFEFSKFSVVSNNPVAVNPGAFMYDDGTGTLSVLPSAVATGVTITYYYDMEMMGAFALTVYEAPEPSTIYGVDFPEYFEEGATKELVLEDVDIRDQYNQPIDISGTDYYIQISEISGTSADADNLLDDSNDATVTATTTEGDTRFLLQLRDSAGDVESAWTYLDVTVVDTSDITSYEFSDVPTKDMYGSPSATSGHYVTLTITGKYESNSVVLAGGEIPTSINSITFSNSTDFEWVDGKSGNIPNSLTIKAVGKGTTSVVAITNNPSDPSFNTSLTADDEEPYADTIARSSSTVYVDLSDGTVDLDTLVVVRDQYGVSMAVDSTSNLFFSSGNDAVAEVSTNGVITLNSTGTAVIGIVEGLGRANSSLTLVVE